MKYPNVCFLDVETTGLDWRRHELLQVGIVVAPVASLFDDDLEKYLRVSSSLYILPEHLETADPEALAVSGFDEARHREEGAASLVEALDVLDRYLPRTYIAGHNVAFDWAFVVEAYRTKHRTPPLVDYHFLDTAALAFPYVVSGEIPSLGLHDIAAALGVPGRKSRHHDALEDATIAHHVARALFKRHRQRAAASG